MNTIRIKQTGWEDNRSPFIFGEAMFQEAFSENSGKISNPIKAGIPGDYRRYGKNSINRARFLPASAVEYAKMKFRDPGPGKDADSSGADSLQTLLVCKDFKPFAFSEDGSPTWKRERGKTLFTPVNAEEFVGFLKDGEMLSAISASGGHAALCPPYEFYEFDAASFSPESGRKFFLKSPAPCTLRHHFPEPAYGFFRPDTDISEIEKLLLFRNNLLVVKGSFGAGKTTLLNYLATWWQTTGLADQVFYFDCSLLIKTEEIRTLKEILRAIAERIFPSEEFSERYFQSLGQAAVQEMLWEKLREERHVLILDHAETLPETPTRDIQEFLAGLSGGRTFVLIGSDKDSAQPLNQAAGYNVYELRGLNFQTASMLAKRILARCKIEDCQGDRDFQKLLAGLKGYPLALEVMLPLLKRYGPAEILLMLKSGTTGGKNAPLRIETLLRCIQFVSVFSPGFQRDMLLCLAPFISVINVKGIGYYTEKLRQQRQLAHLPFDLVPEMIRKAAGEGFLAPQGQISAFSAIQPIFSCVLKAVLYAPGREVVRNAVETAFREYYEALSKAVSRMIRSNSMFAKELEYLLIEPEYENLRAALNISLNSYMPAVNLYRTLSDYSHRNRNRELRKSLGKAVLSGVEKYPQEALKGRTGLEFVKILDEIGRGSLLCKDYSEAEQAYARALTIWLGNETYSADRIRRGSAGLYHQLGRVAQEAGRLEQARDFLLEDLKITYKYNDLSGMKVTLRNLFHLWKESKNEDIPAAVEAVLR